MAIDRWLTTCAGLTVLLLGLDHPAVAGGAAEILQVRAAVHQDQAKDASAPHTIERSRIVFDLAAPRPGTARMIRIEPLPDAAGSAWAVHLNMPLSGRAEAQIRSLHAHLSGLEFDLYQSGAGEPSVLTLRFKRPTVLARHFVLPGGRHGQQERLVLDFVPDSAPAFVGAATTAAETRPAPVGSPGIDASRKERLAVETAQPAAKTGPRSHGPGSQTLVPLSAPATGNRAVVAQNQTDQQNQQDQPPDPRPGDRPGTVQDTEPGVFDAAPPDREQPGTAEGLEPGVFDVGPSEKQGAGETQGRARSQMEPARALPLREDDEFPPPPSGASPLTLWGFFEAEGRWFPQNSRDGVSEHLIGSMAMEPTIEYSWAEGSQFLRFTGFARVDTVTENRTHADVREAKWVGVFGPLELTAGVDRRFWGVTEAVHLVNIINQVDTLEDVDFEDYLGQPLVSAAYTTRYGTFSGFFMPYFRERRFPVGDDRPNLPVRVERDLTQYESGDNNWHADWAVRWSLRRGPIDLGVSHFSGVAREPRLLLNFNERGQPFLVPRYDLIDQTGIDLQATFGAWLLKFEGIHQWNPVRDYAAFAAGFEYTLYGVSAAGADLGILAEYLYDERGKGRQPAPGIPPFSNVSPYDDDVFVGLRWSGNDINTTEILGGAILDLDTKSKAFFLEASRRLGSNLRISLDGRFFTSVSTRDVLYPLGDDDFLQLKLQWHY